MKFILFHPCRSWEYSFIQHFFLVAMLANTMGEDIYKLISKYMAVYGGDGGDGDDGSVDDGGSESVYGIDGCGGVDDIDGGEDEKCKLGRGESVRLTSFPW